MRLKEAEVLTAEMTANVTNLGGHQRTKAEWESLVSISDGCWRTLADGRPAVFKTVCGGPQASSQVHFRPPTFAVAAIDSQRQPSQLVDRPLCRGKDGRLSAVATAPLTVF